MTAEYITVSQLTRTYARPAGPLQALAEVSFIVPRGQRVGLTGASGAGKSTLLNILGGLDRPTSGQVIVGGTDLRHLSPSALALYRRQAVGFIFQDAPLLPAFTVLENVLLPLVPITLNPDERHRRAQKALDEANIAHCAACLPGELSAGERQRAAVARAVVNSPQLILADEPTGELDPENASQIMTLLARLNNEGRTLIIASHDPATLASSERILRLKEGAIIADDH